MYYVDEDSENFKKEYNEEQEKLRTIIKRKILAKDLFRKNKLVGQIERERSERDK